MNRCVLKTFGKKMGVVTLKVVGCILGASAALAIIYFAIVGVGERWMAIIDEAIDLVCASLAVVIVPLAIGSATLTALNDSYKECGR